MATKQNILLLLFFIAILSSCCWDSAIGYEKHLEMPVKTNLNNGFKRGDTLWIEVNNDNSFYDSVQKQSVDFQNGKFDVGVWFNRLNLSQKNLENANNNFACFTHQDFISQRLPVMYQANQYNLKIGFIAKETGLFVLNLMGFENSPPKKENCNNYWYRASVNIKYLEKDMTIEKLKTQNPNFALSDYGFNKFDEARLFFFEINP